MFRVYKHGTCTDVENVKHLQSVKNEVKKFFIHFCYYKWAMFFYDAKKQTDGQKCLLKKFIKIYLKQQRLV